MKKIKSECIGVILHFGTGYNMEVLRNVSRKVGLNVEVTTVFISPFSHFFKVMQH